MAIFFIVFFPPIFHFLPTASPFRFGCPLIALICVMLFSLCCVSASSRMMWGLEFSSRQMGIEVYPFSILVPLILCLLPIAFYLFYERRSKDAFSPF